MGTLTNATLTIPWLTCARPDDCSTHSDMARSETPTVGLIHKHRAFEKLGLVVVQCIYTFLLDSIERFERMNKLLSYLLHLLLQTMPNRCHIWNSNYIFKWSITLVMNIQENNWKPEWYFRDISFIGEKLFVEKYSPIYLTIFYLGELIGIIANVIIFGHCHVLQFS